MIVRRARILYIYVCVFCVPFDSWRWEAECELKYKFGSERTERERGEWRETCIKNGGSERERKLKSR